MANTYKTPSLRGANAVNANSETVTSSDGLRRVTYRNAKRSLGDGRYDIVRVARLKRKVAGKWTVVAGGVAEAIGQNFLETGKIVYVW